MMGILADAQLNWLMMTLNLAVLGGVVGCGFLLFQVNHKLEQMLNKKP